MGRVYSGASPRLLRLVRETCGVKTFVETGTFYGSTTAMASQIFDRVTTIERSKSLYQASSSALAGIPNVEMVFGNSVDELPAIIAKLDEPTVFWLDAHWCGLDTSGESEPCPILGEIGAINESRQQHYVLIDDARAFLAPLEPPYRPDLFPDITTVLAALNSAPYQRYVVIIEDVVIAVPMAAKIPVVDYCQNLNVEMVNRLPASQRALD